MFRRPLSRSGFDSAANADPLEIEADEVVAVPRRAEIPHRPPFPLITALAPLGVAVIVWVILHSPLALVFALLSPVMALANMVDGRLSGRRAQRRGDADVAERRKVFQRRVDRFHADELASLARVAPSARSILDRSVVAFTATAAEYAAVNLGSGTIRSSLRLDAGVDPDDRDGRRLRAEALQLRRAPIIASPPIRIAVVGRGPLVHALARGYAVQLAASIAPDGVRFVAGSSAPSAQSAEWDWVERLPHRAPDAIRLGPLAPVRSALGTAFVIVAETLDDVPPQASVVVVVDSSVEATLVRHPALATPSTLGVEFVSVVDAEGLSARLSTQAIAAMPARFELPAMVSAIELVERGSPSETNAGVASDRGLQAPIGIGEDGAVFSLDLVSDGPHAVVAGTTGSGKSELLVTWVASLARLYDAQAVTVLLVDFKGGAAFDALTGLEQCVGIITDLDPTGAERALSSLRAEIRWREKALREQGARDISDPRMRTLLPRLVIVVDEFAAMLSEFPRLHDVFADIASRGRSLGMHLILCTQRPSGVVKDSLLANCGLRLSLRVNNATDSTAIIGSPAASDLSAEHRGRCLVSAGGRAPIVVQVAHTDASMISSQTARPRDRVRGRSPWLPSLPGTIMLDDLPKPQKGFVLGVLDLPDEQLQPTAVLDPSQHGPLLILGSSRSGKSTLLQTIARQCPSVITVAPGTESTWDSVREVTQLCRDRQRLDGPHAPVVVLCDDLDSVLRRFDGDYQTELLAELTTVLRDGPSQNITLVAASQRLAPPITSLAPLFPERVLLRFASRQEYVVAEGTTHNHDPQLPPGAGHWRGARLQVALSSTSGSVPDSPQSGRARVDPALVLPSTLIVVASRPSLYLESPRLLPSGVRVLDAGDRAALASFVPGENERSWLVGAPDSWIAAWATFAALRARIPVLFDGCSLSDFRTLSRTRSLPPPIDGGREVRWLLHPDGLVERV